MTKATRRSHLDAPIKRNMRRVAKGARRSALVDAVDRLVEALSLSALETPLSVLERTVELLEGRFRRAGRSAETAVGRSKLATTKRATAKRAGSRRSQRTPTGRAVPERAPLIRDSARKIAARQPRGPKHGRLPKGSGGPSPGPPVGDGSPPGPPVGTTKFNAIGLINAVV